MATRSKYHWSIQIAFLLLAIGTGYHLFQAGGASLLTVGIMWGLTQGITWQFILHGIQSQRLDQGEPTTGGKITGIVFIMSLLQFPAIIALLLGHPSIAGSLCVVILATYSYASQLSHWRDGLTKKNETPV